MPDSLWSTGKRPIAKHTGAFEFGAVTLGDDQKAFYAEVNRQIPALCRSLPSSMQTDALLFFMRYCGLSPGDKLDFFRRYPVPAWSIVYWLSRRGESVANLGRDIITSAIKAHALAMCLHSLDDHLVDGEIPTDHLVLLLRSQAWLIMYQALDGLTKNLPGGRTLVSGFLDEYYAGIHSAGSTCSLDDYCGLFRQQMATGFIVPALLTLWQGGDGSYARQIEAAFGAFGIAWRLLDDLQDVPADLARSVPSAVYLCLSDVLKKRWDAPETGNSSQEDDMTEQLLAGLREESVCDRLCQRIGHELDKAADIMQSCGLPGLAHEFRCLQQPFRCTQEVSPCTT